MVVTAPYVRYVIGGSCGSDVWSIGITERLASLSGAPSITQMNATAADTLASFNSFVWNNASTGLKLFNASGVTLSSCKTYAYNSGGLVGQGSASITPVAGAAAANVPFFTAMCVTLLTAFPGRSGRGRTYLPLTGCSANATTGRMATDLSSVVSGFAAFLGGFGPDDSFMPGDPASHAAVLSQKTSSLHDITSVRADNLFDTQRGRVNKLTAGATWTGSVS